MHPFGIIPICPRCRKQVYAAEQIMGPGRKLYHKPCLTCASCNKRLDSVSLVEHDQEPYCKQCHTKLFGTRDLRQANLPHRDDLSPRSQSPFRNSPVNGRSPPPSPTRASGTRPTSPLGLGRNDSGQGVFDISSRATREQMSRSPPPLRTNRALSPTFASLRTDDQNIPSFTTALPEETHGDSEGHSLHNLDLEKSDPPKFGLPRTIPLTTALTNRARGVDVEPITTFTPAANPNDTGSFSPSKPPATGTRYGAALGVTSSPVKPLMSPPTTGAGWTSGRGMPGTGTPLCARCGKPVYFAEQVKASGKTFHKPCLRCTVCNTSLDSGKLTEKDGQVMCQSCYGKLHGPAGSGYALLGKAGG